MLRPFTVDPSLSSLPSPFPSPEELCEALRGGTRRGREIVVRLWLTEGPPFAFRTCPAIYEDLRGWLGSRVDVHPKEITVIGSARIGYSLAPPPEFGRSFNEDSDLDLSIISAALFRRLAEAFNLFAGDYNAGAILPGSERKRKLWDSNLQFGARNIPRGFLDSNKVPNDQRYGVAPMINNAMWALVKKLEATGEAPTVKRASTRVFRDWQSFVDQASLNLRTAVDSALTLDVKSG